MDALESYLILNFEMCHSSVICQFSWYDIAFQPKLVYLWWQRAEQQHKLENNAP